MNIAVSSQKKLLFLTLLFAGVTGCQQDQKPPPTVETAPLHPLSARKDSRIVVPSFVAGKWKSVSIAVIDKSNVSQKKYTIPIGGRLDIPASGLTIKVETFLPAFIMEGSTMTSSSNELTNPGVRVQVLEKGTVIFHGWLFSKFPNTHVLMHPKYGFTLLDVVPASR